MCVVSSSWEKEEEKTTKKEDYQINYPLCKNVSSHKAGDAKSHWPEKQYSKKSQQRDFNKLFKVFIFYQCALELITIWRPSHVTTPQHACAQK
ncbi:hypothetical protein ATANTOWER_027946 [Ataeniobius toweri]|uniref:Uncharacterized protein n=1 Tax=Ataeniobius toweri TaxID=208326 RepID=A0ABU7C766_9TELE|nr:hypothetical protein [Ataeniobius toweri]